MGPREEVHKECPNSPRGRGCEHSDNSPYAISLWTECFAVTPTQHFSALL